MAATTPLKHGNLKNVDNCFVPGKFDQLWQASCYLAATTKMSPKDPIVSDDVEQTRPLDSCGLFFWSCFKHPQEKNEHEPRWTLEVERKWGETSLDLYDPCNNVVISRITWWIPQNDSISSLFPIWKWCTIYMEGWRKDSGCPQFGTWTW